MKIFKLKIFDKVVIVVLLIISILPTGLIMLAKSNKENSTIVIKVENKVEKRVSLNKINESKTYEFGFNDNVGYIEVKDGKVRMLEMDKEICPNAICSDAGWINKGYQSIVCLPNNIVVTIESSENEFIDVQAS
ncbi:NusG domain II-containing protein [Clostridium swellfunianum]|uniref:NusG domain II-containing protein n=1 Tax=Clostridium swellfunianum TaxID=1367462 RepID=UPI00202FF93F|nr:NusG domain II-containing protein [Clostridium swellfunianum]MCM0647277.1 NusG domain II-containing protein [Clostridium swellfunianum]